MIERPCPVSAGLQNHFQYGVTVNAYYVPPKKNLAHPWKYDRKLYKRRNETERFFQRLKGSGGIFTRYDKLDRMFTCLYLSGGYLYRLRCVNRPWYSMKPKRA
jgi:hypothetical protein